MDFSSLSDIDDSCHSEGNLSYNGESTPKNDSGCDMPDGNSCDDLSHQSQCSLGDTPKKVFYNLGLGTKLDYHKKIDDLLRCNRQLEHEVKIAKEQLERLLRCSDTDSVVSNAYLELERKYYEVQACKSTLQLKLSQIEGEKNEIESYSKCLQVEKGHCMIDLVTKSAVISELKQTISSQFVKIQQLTSGADKNAIELNELKSELQLVQNQNQWFKVQLKNQQKDKTAILTELANLRSQIILLQRKNHHLDADKENFKTQLEALQFINTQNESKVENDETYLTEIQQLKALVVIKDKIYNELSSEKSTAVAQCVKLQKSLEEMKQTVGDLVKKNAALETEILLNNRQQEISAVAHEKTETEVVGLKSVLFENYRERHQVESFVDMLKKQFSRLEMKFNSMIIDSVIKNKKMLDLQQEIQKLYMEKNWQICELEKAKQKEKYISGLRDEIQKHIREIEALKAKQLETDSELSDLHKEKTEISSGNLLQVQRYEFVLQQYKDLLLNSEKKFSMVKESYENKTDVISNLNVAMDNLKMELNPENSALSELEDQKKSVENSKLLVKDQEIKKLRVLLRVRELNAAEKQEKFEAKISTLLRKVREQISEKRSIKKRYGDELNSLKSSYETLKAEKEIVSKPEEESICNKCPQHESENALKAVMEMQQELECVNSEKFFLQRLNNDLKFALREQVNYNKVLKKGVQEQTFLSLPNIPTHVLKYDENYIHRVLQKNKALSEKNKFFDVQSCLDSMKENIQSIQEDFRKKNRN